MIAGMYEVIPVRGVIPAVPVLGPALHHVDELRSAHTIRITGAATVFFQADAARREAEAMLASCRGEVERGHHYALMELLDANPAFMAVAWVRETCRSFVKEGHPLRRRGRIRGKYTFHPLMLVGLVRHLIAMGDAKSPEQAFGLLEELRVLPYGTAKDLYYRGVQEDRFKPILLEFPEYAQQVTAAELQGFLARVEMLEPGRPVQRTIQDPRLGEVEITFRAQ